MICNSVICAAHYIFMIITFPLLLAIWLISGLEIGNWEAYWSLWVKPREVVQVYDLFRE